MGANEKIAFIKALDALVDYHNLMRAKMTTPATPVTPVTPKKNRFVSFLEKVGHDFKVGLDKVLPIAATAGEVAVSMFAPGASTLFNQTMAAVVTAEQSAAAVGNQSGTGTQKLASVVSLMGPLIAQALADVGKPNDDASVQKYISAVVTVLNAIPAPSALAVAPTGGTVTQIPAPIAGTPAEAAAGVQSGTSALQTTSTSGSAAAELLR